MGGCSTVPYIGEHGLGFPYRLSKGTHGTAIPSTGTCFTCSSCSRAV